jgi:hypothetical protein
VLTPAAIADAGTSEALVARGDTGGNRWVRGCS